MAARDGDGWVDCSCGQKHWGIHGAAGIVIVHAARDEVLMQLRAPWTHGGQTWGFPGGARDSHETVIDAALRELLEELGVTSDDLDILHDDTWADHGQWSYHTVIARAKNEITVTHNDESVEVRWIALEDVDGLDLHPGVRGAWEHVVAHVRRLITSEETTN